MNEDFFWDIIKRSGKNCDDINIIRNDLRKKDESLVKKLDNEFSKYHSLIWAKFEPIMGDYYNENSRGFTEFVFYLLSKGPYKLNKFLNKNYSTNYFKDFSKFNVEYKIEDQLYNKKSPYQLIQVFKTIDFGNILVIDNDIQLTEVDEVNYHEMIAHVPLNYFTEKIRVLIVGGGDGGTLREVLKHPNVEEVIMVEIDKDVVDVCKKYLPSLPNGAFDNSKTKLIITDGFKFVKDYNGDKFDMVIVDSTDFNQSISLHTSEFYENVKKIVKPKHLICFNADNINWNEKHIISMYTQMKKLFKYVNPYVVFVPCFVGGFYSFCLCSDTINPTNFNIDWEFFNDKNLKLDYYNENIHNASFSLPNKLKKNLSKIDALSADKSCGVHYILDINDVSDLSNEKVIDNIFTEAIRIGDVKILNSKIHKFEPQGLTGLYLLSTSHLSFHTYPEFNRIYIDLFSCGDKNKTKEAIKYIINKFNSNNYKLTKIIR